ncbi:hypothetical protein SCHPADRAFT_994842 [Schizopora paradoxa]|uniref:Zinc-finger domain-containing protein n=1 Tax=Schizopora paradoxa TaxID=27342 RepID=A0A0H2RYQ3_9AGAM|nr:hypothetical protein SCHPADRAFT_994842 [Schizopora paradoxa]
MAYSELANWDGSLTNAIEQQRRYKAATSRSNKETAAATPISEEIHHADSPSSSTSVQIVDDLLEAPSEDQVPASSTLSVSNSLADELFPEAKIFHRDNDSRACPQQDPQNPPPIPPTPPPDPVVTPKKKKRGRTPTMRDSTPVNVDSVTVSRSQNPDPQPRYYASSLEAFIELPRIEGSSSKDSYRSLDQWYADGRCKAFFGESEVHCQSTSSLVKEEPVEPEEEAPSETESYLELVVLDAYCHHCRRKNRYAKMKCTNLLEDGDICSMEFCHMCIYQRYPEITFEPFCRTFVCPRCLDKCNCNLCCEKRGHKYWKTPSTSRPPSGYLFLSELGRRQQEAAQQAEKRKRSRQGPGPSTKRAKSRAPEKPIIGSEAQQWISSHLDEYAPSRSRVLRPRIFVGEWVREWGEMASIPASVSMVCVDIPTASSSDPAGKGKGRAIEPLARVYIGDREAMSKPFVSMDEVKDIAQKSRRPRKPSAKVRGDFEIADDKPRKRRRGPGKAKKPIPEFTINHQEHVADHLGISDSFHGPLQSPEHDSKAYPMWGEDMDDLGPGFEWERSNVFLPPVSPLKGLDDPTSFDEQYRAAFEQYSILPSAPQHDPLIGHGFDPGVYDLDRHSHFNDLDFTHGLQPSSINPTLGHVPETIDPALLPLSLPSPKASRFDIHSPTLVPQSHLPIDSNFLSGPSGGSFSSEILPVDSRTTSLCPSSPKSTTLSYQQIECAIRNALKATFH